METRVTQLQQQILDLRRRLPAHSVKPAMLLELEELETELVTLLSQSQRSEGRVDGKALEQGGEEE